MKHSPRASHFWLSLTFYTGLLGNCHSSNFRIKDLILITARMEVPCGQNPSVFKSRNRKAFALSLSDYLGIHYHEYFAYGFITFLCQRRNYSLDPFEYNVFICKIIHFREKEFGYVPYILKQDSFWIYSVRPNLFFRKSGILFVRGLSKVHLVCKHAHPPLADILHS